MTAAPGAIIHNVPLQPADLPEHDAATAGADGARPSLERFIHDTLLEGDAFLSTITWAGPANAKPSSPSSAPVEIGKRDIDLEGAEKVAFDQSFLPSRRAHPPTGREHWYGRRSVHANEARPGTASFQELDFGLRQDHSPKEAEYTPDIYDCVTVVDYAAQIGTLDFGGAVLKPDLKVYEMAHNLGAMLTPRVFAAAVVSGQLDQGKKFVVVQLPIDLSAFDGAMYSNGRNLREGDSKLKQKRCIQGYYASIERGVDLGDNTEWAMVTSSDAGGNLPQWLQNMVAPGKVVHDVGLFMKWNDGKRAQTGTP